MEQIVQTKRVANPGPPTSATHAFHQLRAIAPDYATMPILDGFNWSECLGEIEQGQWYLVVFRSVRREAADEHVLTEFDDGAYAEALSAAGFLFYFKGQLGDRRECLSLCLWDTQHDAKAALRLPRHQTAVSVVAQMYESYALERYILTKNVGSSKIQLQRLS
jgi:hypothetical protein